MGIGDIFGRRAQARKYGTTAKREPSIDERAGRLTWEDTGEWLGHRLVSEYGNAFFQTSFDGRTFEVLGPNGEQVDSNPETWRKSAEMSYMRDLRGGEIAFMHDLKLGIYNIPFPSIALQERGRSDGDERCNFVAIDSGTVMRMEDFLSVAGHTKEDHEAKMKLAGAYAACRGTDAKSVDIRFDDGSFMTLGMDKFLPRSSVVPAPVLRYRMRETMERITGRGHEFDGAVDTGVPEEEPAVEASAMGNVKTGDILHWRTFTAWHGRGDSAPRDHYAVVVDDQGPELTVLMAYPDWNMREVRDGLMTLGSGYSVDVGRVQHVSADEFKGYRMSVDNKAFAMTADEVVRVMAAAAPAIAQDKARRGRTVSRASMAEEAVPWAPGAPDGDLDAPDI